MLFGGVPYSREAAASQETIEASVKWELENAPGEPAQAMGSDDDQMGCAAGLPDDHHMNNMSLEYEGIRLTLRHEHRLFLCAWAWSNM